MEKSLRQMAKEAKARLKSGFWQKHKACVDERLNEAEKEGLNKTRVAEYYQSKVVSTIKGNLSVDEEFYQKVKNILDTVGETSDILGRLTDMEYYQTLSYEQKQRYSMELSSKYRNALERYKKELKYEKVGE